MVVQSKSVNSAPNQDAGRADSAARTRPAVIAAVVRTMLIIVSGLLLITASVVSTASAATLPSLFEPPVQHMPGSVVPAGLHCGETVDQKCFLPIDAHCYELSDANAGCFTSALVSDNGKVIALNIDVATRTIATTTIMVPGYAIGDLLLAWGTPTGFSQYGRNIDVYWGTRSAHLTTCLFYPGSEVDMITYYSAAPYTAPWHGFISAFGVECQPTLEALIDLYHFLYQSLYRKTAEL